MKLLVTSLFVIFSNFSYADTLTIQCSGTEPFWGFNLQGSSATADINGENLEISQLKSTSFHGRPHHTGQVVFFRSKGQPYTMSAMRAAGCSDGMSERSYNAYVSLTNTASQQALSGCCNIKDARDIKAKYSKLIHIKKGDGLNIRSGPGTHYNVIGKIPFASPKILTRHCKKKWCQVSYNPPGTNFTTISGWAHSYYLKPLK